MARVLLLVVGLVALVSAVGFTSDEIKKETFAAVIVNESGESAIVKDVAIVLAVPERVDIDKGRDNPFAALWVERTADGYAKEEARPPVA